MSWNAHKRDNCDKMTLRLLSEFGPLVPVSNHDSGIKWAYPNPPDAHTELMSPYRQKEADCGEQASQFESLIYWTNRFPDTSMSHNSCQVSNPPACFKTCLGN
ncbi:hypothetical protein RRG08_056619 [Elysia crispata]|uniref:Uncharacterized protein n=1 Tax=Elysia crispata TaxID=231223 RepID=A0AAE1E968_9GAST|nr:hypothetical protein RRG08_056619 [Elysia crispata]